jgi:hypothetical protein
MDRFDLDPRNPIYDLAYDPKGGSGILKAQIWIDTHGGEHKFEYFLAYTWSETVNGIELDIQKPNLYFASSLEEDIMDSLRKEDIKFDTINWVTL